MSTRDQPLQPANRVARGSRPRLVRCHARDRGRRHASLIAEITRKQPVQLGSVPLQDLGKFLDSGLKPLLPGLPEDAFRL
ncbi:hypothetical protein [Streptomyces anulatus]|uniref:hypothetical protein n=1 Tax=Streptomyces anulatus TaxID=1892 RepID=UPI0013CC763F|nr:hypothetical protein [Streptomyces anulatus]NED28574.1 hypothetical protein [Streptomyces anulatus]